jgi:hypothetical protein
MLTSKACIAFPIFLCASVHGMSQLEMTTRPTFRRPETAERRLAPRSAQHRTIVCMPEKSWTGH